MNKEDKDRLCTYRQKGKHLIKSLEKQPEKYRQIQPNLQLNNLPIMWKMNGGSRE